MRALSLFRNHAISSWKKINFSCNDSFYNWKYKIVHLKNNKWIYFVTSYYLFLWLPLEKLSLGANVRGKVAARNWNKVINKLELTANNNNGNKVLAKLHFWDEAVPARAKINGTVVVAQHANRKVNEFESNQVDRLGSWKRHKSN